MHIDVVSFPQQFSNVVFMCSPAQLGSRPSRVLSPGTGGSGIGRPESKGREGAPWSTAQLFRGWQEFLIWHFTHAVYTS